MVAVLPSECLGNPQPSPASLFVKRLAVIVWFSVLSLGSTFPPLPNEVRFSLCLLTAGCLMVQTRSIHQTSMKRFGASLLLCLFFGWQLVSAAWNEVLTNSNVVMFAALAAVVIALARQPWELIQNSFLEAAIAILALGWLAQLLNWIHPSMPTAYFWSFQALRHQGLYIHPNAIGMLATITAVCMLFSSKSRWWLLLPIATVLASEYRGGVLAFFISLAIKGVTAARGVKKILMGFGVVGLATILVPELAVARQGSSDPTSDRRFIWSVCRDLTESGGMIGRGPGAVIRAFGYGQGNSMYAAHCHNQALDDWVNFGIVGLGLLAVFVLAALYLSSSSPLAGPLAISVSLCIIGLFEVPLRLYGALSGTWCPVLVSVTLLATAANNTERLRAKTARKAAFLLQSSVARQQL